MLRTSAICALLVAALAMAGCGGSDDSSNEADEDAITGLIDRMNSAAQSQNAEAFCAIMQPSAIESTFHGIERCIKETQPILKAAGDQPVYEIESIEVDGDLAAVRFEGNTANETTVVKENGEWFIPINSESSSGGTSPGTAAGES